jgi:nucleoside-diphosphate-sugar epimerase
MAKIALIGSGGYVGGALFQKLQNISEHEVFGITRENYKEHQPQEFDILINCAMPSGRFWAKNNPAADFIETVKKTADLLYGWKFKKFIQTSTISARCQTETVYGRHKLAAEKLCDFGENLIVRLGVLYSAGNHKGALADMLAGKTVFMDGSSRHAFIALDFCAAWIAQHLDRQGTVELGGKNAITLRQAADHLGIHAVFSGEANHLEIENTADDLPEANQVLFFLDELKKQ